MSLILYVLVTPVTYVKDISLHVYFFTFFLSGHDAGNPGYTFD